MDELAYRKSMESRNSLALNPTMDSFMLMQLLRNLPNSDNEKQHKLELLTLHRIDLDYNTTFEIIDQLSRWSQVEVDNCQGDHMHSLLEAILKHANIKQLSISGEELDEASIGALRDGIAGDSHGLQELSLTIDMSRESTCAIVCEGINRSSLAKLDLSQCDFSPDSIEVLCTALQSNSTLISLNLEMCRLDDNEVAGIVQSLESNQQLSELSLGMNYAEDDAMLAVCNLLRSPRSGLKSLNFSQQNPGTLDLISFAAALSENRTLQRIDFRESFVQHAHVAALTEALNHNTTVQELNLENCGLTNSMLSILVERLDGWSGLVKLYLRDNECRNQLDAATLKGNCILQVLDIEQELIHPNIYFHLCLNRGGRQFLETNRIPLALWPILFFRVNRIFEKDDSIPPDSHHGIGAADVLYYLLKGSVF
jgi:hypothetical protein